MTVIT